MCFPVGHVESARGPCRRRAARRRVPQTASDEARAGMRLVLVWDGTVTERDRPQLLIERFGEIMRALSWQGVVG